jgi:hypothetical protein
MILTKKWCKIEHFAEPESEQNMDVNYVFATNSDEEEIFPLTISEIAEEQLEDKALHQQKMSSKLVNQLIENTIVLYKEGKLVIPKTLQHKTVAWYHHYLQHPGHTRLEETLRAVTYWKGMRSLIRSHTKTCKPCQINKLKKKKYGKIPTQQVITTPWEYLCVDLIGPYTLRDRDKSEIDFMCLTMIDPASSWFEIVELPVADHVPTEPVNKDGKTKEAYFDKSSFMISHLVNKCWFSRYPRCRNIIYDNGSKFKLNFKAICDSYRVKRKPTSIKNPQANAILEQIHQVVMTMVCTSEINMADSVAPSDIDAVLTNASWAIFSTNHTVRKASPGSAIFGRDMMFDIPFIADWKKIGDYRQRQTDQNTIRENSKRFDYDNAVGGKVLILKDGKLHKAESPKQPEPWTITIVHTNGTIRVTRGTKSERINVRRVEPFFERNE